MVSHLIVQPAGLEHRQSCRIARQPAADPILLDATSPRPSATGEAHPFAGEHCCCWRGTPPGHAM